MPLSKQRWDEIEANLSHQFGSVVLKCDGYQVHALVQSYKMRLQVMIYINGEFKYEWIDGKDSRCIKFFRKTKKYLLRSAERKKALNYSKDKSLNKLERDYFKRHAEAFIEQWVPYWTSPKAFCSHIRKTCTDIEFIR